MERALADAMSEATDAEPSAPTLADRINAIREAIESIWMNNMGLPIDLPDSLVAVYESTGALDQLDDLDIDLIEEDLAEFEAIPANEKHEHRVDALLVKLGREEAVVLPMELLKFSTARRMPSADELDHLVNLFVRWKDGTYREDMNGREIHEREEPAVEARPLSQRIHQPEDRADFIDRLAKLLVTFDRERRWHSVRARQRAIVEQLADVPAFKAEQLAEELFNDVLTEVHRRERRAAVGSLDGIAFLMAHETGVSSRV